jgi:hypothetical protein
MATAALDKPDGLALVDLPATASAALVSLAPGPQAVGADPFGVDQVVVAGDPAPEAVAGHEHKIARGALEGDLREQHVAQEARFGQLDGEIELLVRRRIGADDGTVAS